MTSKYTSYSSASKIIWRYGEIRNEKVRRYWYNNVTNKLIYNIFTIIKMKDIKKESIPFRVYNQLKQALRRSICSVVASLCWVVGLKMVAEC